MNATPRPYKMIGKDGDAFVVCQPDKHGKNRTIAHIYEENTAYQFVRAVNSYDAMRRALQAVIAYHDSPYPSNREVMIDLVNDALALAKGDQ